MSQPRVGSGTREERDEDLEGLVLQLEADAVFPHLASLEIYLEILEANHWTTITYTSPSSGSAEYAAYCASCHGSKGQGNGPAAAELKERPANLTQLSKTHGGKFPEMLVYTTLHDGPSAPGHEKVNMPVWNDLFMELDGTRSDMPQLRLTSLTEYVRSLQVK